MAYNSPDDIARVTPHIDLIPSVCPIPPRKATPAMASKIAKDMRIVSFSLKNRMRSISVHTG